MWAERDYSYEGTSFTVPYPHNVLPKPYRKGHPPIWVACGNPTTFTQAGEMGIGAIAFNFEPVFGLKGRIAAYKEGIAAAPTRSVQFKNDNVMLTNAVICLSDRDRAREAALRLYRGYLYSLVCLYHDTIPKPDYAPTWPESIAPPGDEATLDQLIEEGWLLCGGPDEVAEQVARYQRSTATRLSSGFRATPSNTTKSSRCSRSSAARSSPSSTRTRSTRRPATGRPRCASTPNFSEPVPDLRVSGLPVGAMIQMDGTRKL